MDDTTDDYTPGSDQGRLRVAKLFSGDIDNDGNISISDAIDILRHIVDLEAIDTFDIIDASGNLVTTLDANASDDAPTWTIVANGDVNMSSGFVDDYVIDIM